MKKWIFRILTIAFLIGFVFFGLKAFMDWKIKKVSEESLMQLQEQSSIDETETEIEQEEVEPEEEEERSVLEERGIEVPEKELDFEKLQSETNEHIYAWICLPGTNVDYPIVRHPTEDSYYLNRNLDGSQGYPGCIYTDFINAADFSDPNTVIYGHNMKNGTMFGSLRDFRDSAFFEENHYLFIYAPEKIYVYDIFAAYEYPAIHLVYNFDLENKEIFQNYLDQIFEIRDMSANINRELKLTSEDRIVTLSTCIDDKPNERYLVQGVLIYEGDR